LNGNYEGKLILIDDLDIIYKRYKTEIINFIEKNKGNIVATSDCLFWNSLKTNKDFLMPSAELITIKNLEVYEIIELLNNRIKQTIIDKSNIDGRIINEIGIISDGKPYKAIRVGRRYLKYLIINDSELNFNTFNTFVNEELHLVSKKTIFGIINTLNEKQKTAMDIIINEVEVDANELGEKLNITRNGALQYLKFFEDNNIVESKFKGRRKIYYVPNEIQEDLVRSDHEID
jgi:DNA-binding MarR family transcriptional regulator